MSDDEFLALLGSPDQQLSHAQACLDLFEKDWGRCATSALDLRHWADLQGADSLRFRILRRVRAAESWRKACRAIWRDVPAPLATRPPIGQRIWLTLAQAAQATGRRIRAARRHRRRPPRRHAGHAGRLAIERAALARAFPSARSACDSDQPLDAATLLLGLSPLATIGAPRRGRTLLTISAFTRVFNAMGESWGEVTGPSIDPPYPHRRIPCPINPPGLLPPRTSRRPG
jgi:hypothetical protein